MADTIRLSSRGLTAIFDAETGTLRSLTSLDGCEFIGNADNTSYPQILEKPQWTGDLLLRTWNADGSWLTQRTSVSGDIRKVSGDERCVIVEYSGSSKAEDGLKNLAVSQHYRMQDRVLMWDICIKNTSDSTVELGELSLPFMTNNDFTGLFMKDCPAIRPSDNKKAQELWHTDRVMQHIHVAKHSSYVMLQRPDGEFPGLVFAPVGDETYIEAAYQIDHSIGDQFSCTFEGPYYLSTYSSAARRIGHWLGHRDMQRYGLCGHTSAMIEPGEEKHYSFGFFAIDSYSEIGKTLYDNGQLALTVAPSMTAPLGTDIRFKASCKSKPEFFTEANGALLCFEKQNGDDYYYSLKFTTVGQKRIRVKYGGRETLLYFYAIPGIVQSVIRHAQFLIKNQYYQNQNDPYGRYHAFLPYDNMYDTLFLEGDESWQVAGSDEYCLPPAMFLAEKNVYLPNEAEIATMEEYIDDFLFNVLQNPETFEVKRGCYWEEARPSAEWNWTYEKANQTSRSFNYILVADIYHSMYRIGKLHGLLKRRKAEEYLDMAARSSIMGFTRGFHSHMAGPGGFGSIWLLRDLKAENSPYYEELYNICLKFAEENAADPYPFGSELYTDQTAHHQIYAYMKEFGFKQKELQTIRVSKALRGGRQPSWYGYGREQRGSVCCFYATAHNSYTLLRGFEEVKDAELLELGFGGLLGYLTTIRESGAATGWYTWWPDRQGFDPRSLDTDLGMYALMKVFKSYVSEHPDFGLYGWCCDVEANGSEITVVPRDGLQKRMYLAPWEIDIEVEKAEIEKVIYDKSTGRLRITFTDRTGLVGDANCVVRLNKNAVFDRKGIPIGDAVQADCSRK